MTQVNLEEKLATFSEHWQPRTVSQFNGHDVMVVKAKEEVNLLLIEPSGTPDTGDVATAATRRVI